MKRFPDPAQDASPTPANEAVIAGLRAEALRQIAPSCYGVTPKKMPLRKTAVIHTRRAARLVRQHRPDGSPLIIGEFNSA